MWRRRLADFNAGWAIAFLNLHDSGHPKSIVTSLNDLGIPGNLTDERIFELIDAFTGGEMITVMQKEPIEIHINPNGIVMAIIRPVD